MGFQVNGCGTTDNYQRIMYIGRRNCGHCGKEQDFYLYKHYTKITFLWVPVASIKSDYSIRCGACEYGYEISEEEKNKLLNEGIDEQ